MDKGRVQCLRVTDKANPPPFSALEQKVAPRLTEGDLTEMLKRP